MIEPNAFEVLCLVIGHSGLMFCLGWIVGNAGAGAKVGGSWDGKAVTKVGLDPANPSKVSR